MVYLDNAATTPLNTAAISAMTHVMTETFGNPSSLHAYGRQASKELREAREEMAKQFQVPALIASTVSDTASRSEWFPADLEQTVIPPDALLPLPVLEPPPQFPDGNVPWLAPILEKSLPNLGQFGSSSAVVPNPRGQPSRYFFAS